MPEIIIVKLKTKTPSFLSQGPGNAENEPHHLPLDSNVHMSFAWKPQNEYFDPRKAREISKNNFRCPKIDIFGPCWVGENWKDAFGSFKMSIFGPVPGMQRMRFTAKSLKKYENI